MVRKVNQKLLKTGQNWFNRFSFKNFQSVIVIKSGKNIQHITAFNVTENFLVFVSWGLNGQNLSIHNLEVGPELVANQGL